MFRVTVIRSNVAKHGNYFGWEDTKTVSYVDFLSEVKFPGLRARDQVKIHCLNGSGVTVQEDSDGKLQAWCLSTTPEVLREFCDRINAIAEGDY